ncbi:hypothetical protein V7S43_006583 [Phytophthora oleae]|uniref:Uncharacterized protein n=1 Tax=Phytophthora oleae TaxID=2107226 RepID=A0ABD3FS30_9STRA
MPDEGSKKRERRENSHPSSSLATRAPEVMQEYGGIALCFQDGNCLASPLPGPMNTTMISGLVDKKMAQRFADQKLKKEEALDKCALAAKQEREAKDTRVTTVKWRRKLKEEGYSTEEIDYAAPL